MTSRVTLSLALAASLLGCGSEPEPTPRLVATEPAPARPEPDHHPIRHVCAGFDLAVAEGAPQQRLLSSSTKHAIELGGERVELASRRWALTPAHELLVVLDRYERETQADPKACAGLRAHLERMSLRSASH